MTKLNYLTKNEVHNLMADHYANAFDDIRNAMVKGTANEEFNSSNSEAIEVEEMIDAATWQALDRALTKHIS